jgi:uncharacterized RDD family membrane protein YckC
MELYREDRELVRHRPAMWRGYVLSGWWRRVGATLLDAFVVIPIGALLAVALGTDLDQLWSESSGSDHWLATAGSALAVWLYFPTIMRATDGRALGKMATRIRVVRTDGKAMSFTRAAWREAIVKSVPSVLPGLLFMVAPLDDLWPLWDPQNRAIHDMLAGTRVVRSDIQRARNSDPS